MVIKYNESEGAFSGFQLKNNLEPTAFQNGFEGDVPIHSGSLIIFSIVSESSLGWQKEKAGISRKKMNLSLAIGTILFKKQTV